MQSNVLEELIIYKSKLSVKESWVEKNLPNLWMYVTNLQGDTLSEKIYLLDNNNIRPTCKMCGSNVKFLSISRGYREYCSKKCSNSDPELSSIKMESLRKTSLDKYGVDNPSKSDIVKRNVAESRKGYDYTNMIFKIREKMLDKYGVDNISKTDWAKDKKKETTLKNWGVENPFQSDIIKENIQRTLIDKIGVDHPMRSKDIREKVIRTNLDKYGVDNYTKSKEYRDGIFDRYRKGLTQTTLNQDNNFVSYKGNGQYEMFCDKGHNYITNSHLWHARKSISKPQCTVCNPVERFASILEDELYEYVSSVYDGEIIQNYRSKMEIDIYLPDINLGFEFNGLYWHSELYKDSNYHINKLRYFQEKGIRIINIWEDDWVERCEIVKSQIKNWIGLNSGSKIWARNCEVREVEKSEALLFLDENHIQGKIASSVKIGLYHNDVLVSMMSFDHFEGRNKMLDTEWNLNRFCSLLGYNIVGGASKLLKYFINTYKPTRIITFADLSWSTGNLYYKIGFIEKSVTKPNWTWLIDKRRVNKQRWKKSKLVKLGYDPDRSEVEIMESEFGAVRVFDCGQIKFEMIIEKPTQ
jgi:hypothetical protein